jgi:hypothetical protein
MLVETMQEMVPESLGSRSLTTRLLLSGLNSTFALHSSVITYLYSICSYKEWGNIGSVLDPDLVDP